MGHADYSSRVIRDTLLLLSLGILGSTALIGLPDPAGAIHECDDGFDSCSTEAEDVNGRCVAACPDNDGECQVFCRDEFDLAIGQCEGDRDDCLGVPADFDSKGCGQTCREGGIRCDRRATQVRTRCKSSCLQSFQASVDDCPDPPRGLAIQGSRHGACVSSAQSTRRDCEVVCHDERIDEFAACTELEDSCETVYCAEISFPSEFGEFGTFSNFAVRNEVNIGCPRYYPGMFPEECTQPGSGERDPYQTTAGLEFIDLPNMTTKFLARHEGTTAAISFSAIEAVNESANNFDARSPIFVRALIDGQVVDPGPVHLSYTVVSGGGAFTFVSGALAKGIHTAQIQWRVDPDLTSEDDPIALLRTGTILVRTGRRTDPEGDEEATLTMTWAAPTDPDLILGAVETTGPWIPITESDGVTPMSVDFLSPLDASVAILFSAEVSASHFGALDVRARLANGSVDEGVVMMALGLPTPNRDVFPPPVAGFASRSWTFTRQLHPPGFNTVEFDWRYRYQVGGVPGPGEGIQSVAMDRRTAVVIAAPSLGSDSRVELAVPAAPASEVVATNDWELIPGLERVVAVPENAQVAITFNAQIQASNLVHLRLLVDGQPVDDSEVELAQSFDAQGVASHIYALKHLAAGDYDIAVAWKVSGTDSAGIMTRRNLVLAIEELPVPDLGDGPDVAAAAGQNLNDPVEHPIEPLTAQKQVLVVIVDPERPRLDEITLSNTPDGLYTVNLNGDAFDFNAAGSTANQIRDGLIAAINAGAQPVSAVTFTSANAQALAAFRIIADNLGANEFTTTLNSPDGMSLNLCPAGASCHSAPIPNAGSISQLAFGVNQSAAHFWNVVSQGRLELVPAGPGVIGPYQPDFTGVAAIDHYWRGTHNCDGASTDEVYGSGHGERFAQGLIAAAASGDFDFPAFDANRDGILQESELVIVVATPQSSNGGSAFSPNFRPYCDLEQPVDLNGVEMKGFISWYTGNGTNLSDVVTLSHEEGHFPVGLDDMYTLNNNFTPATADHDPAQKSIMSATSSSAWQHLDGFQKLALGWVTPRIVRENGIYDLEDVKTGGQVLILPRAGSLGREYFVIENRQATAAGDDLYDRTIGDSGLAIYLVTEPTYAGAFACLSNTPSAPDCLPMSPGQCSYPPPTFQFTTGNYIRRVLRMIRSGIAVQGNGSGAFWDAGEGQITDAPPVCPPNFNPMGSLVWSDGTASGYSISPLPAAGPVMSLPINAP